MTSPARNSLAVIGAGPVGLEAAARALEQGIDVHVFERGEVGAHLLAWGHVRMFTPWRDAIGPASARLLTRNGWSAPDPDARPNGAEMVERVLRPLAACPELRERVHEHAQVVHVGRRGLLRHELAADREARSEQPFRLLVRDAGGRENVLHAFAVIDASGTYGSPLRAGSGGIPARGESYLAPQMSYRCDDVRGLRRERHAGRRTLVIGDGASAATTVTELAALADEAPGTTVAWALRGDGTRFAGERRHDPLPARAELFAAARALLGGGHPAVTVVTDVEVEGFEFNSATHRYRVAFAGAERPRVEEVDEVVVNAGFGPDASHRAELRVHACPVTGAPMLLSEALDAAGDEDVPDMTPAVLANPEPDFWILGAASYGRRDTFLLPAGWAQVAAVLA